MNISKEEVLKVARLARLELAEAEVDSITAQLDKVFGYVVKLNEVDTENIKPTTHAIEVHNAFREDVVQPSLSQEEALANGPNTNSEAFIVPKVI